MATKRLTRQEKRAQIRADLLDAAHELFAERGYWGVSLDEIAERAGVTKGAVYSNFASKEQLLLEVSWRQRLDLDPSLLTDRSLPLEEVLRALGAEIARLATSEEQRKLAPREMEIATLALTNAKIQEVVVGMQRLQRQNLAALLTAQASARGIDLPLPAEELAALFRALVQGLMQQRFLEPDAIPPEYFVDALGLLFGGSSPKASEERQGHP